MKMSEINIYWYKGEPAIVILDGVSLWKADLQTIENDDGGGVVTLSMPFLQALKFCVIFVNGISTEKMLEISRVVRLRISELQAIEERHKQLDLSIGDW